MNTGINQRPSEMKDSEKIFPTIEKRRKVYSTKWFELNRKTVWLSPERKEYYYSLNEGDHVTIVPQDDNGNIILVRQYRPAIEDYVIELPGGHVEKGDPLLSAHNELIEETGYKSTQLKFMNKIIMDSGRNEGFLYCYFAKGLKKIGPQEEGIQNIYVTKKKILKLIERGEMKHSINISAIFMALLKNYLI